MKKMDKYCFFRVDANEIIGTGHFVRCNLIADNLEERGVKTIFFVKNTPDNYISSYDGEIVKLTGDNELEETIELLNNYVGKKILITDGDHSLFYNEFYQKEIIASGTHLMTITLYSDCHFYSNLVFNQNILSLDQHYKGESYTKLLLGPKYLILNPCFLKTEPKKKVFQERTKVKVFLYFGGADYHNLTIKIFEKLAPIKDFITEVNIVLGKLNPNKQKLLSIIEDSKKINTKVFEGVNNMAELMVKADIAITSSGLSVWELGYLGIPNYVVSTSDRERLTATELSKRDLITYIGHCEVPNNLEEVLLDSIAYNGELERKQKNFSELIDGKGLHRVSEELIDLYE